ncbi:protein of unknown function [Rhodovastum atsumiense]|nr:hypothetical protein [Rhodovastum atsumiense]CAH2603119.1 protein of unknown function [Rhodovastum atsumiense]
MWTAFVQLIESVVDFCEKHGREMAWEDDPVKRDARETELPRQAS